VIRPTVFVDVDATITLRDATDAILEAYADPEWFRIEEDWRAGRICLRQSGRRRSGAPELIGP
jgi:2-hydroxy-3-keto-5-methylthiopentenyl-1-phosphate phosphatase